MKDKFYAYIEALQDRITGALEAEDGKARFRQDLWERPEGGGDHAHGRLCAARLDPSGPLSGCPSPGTG